MPYIHENARDAFRPAIHDVITECAKYSDEELDGVLNYVISTVVNHAMSRYPWNYHRISRVMGIFESAKLEFYRRRAAPYEDKKIKDNGDVVVYRE